MYLERTFRLTLGVWLLSAVWASPAQADILARWTFEASAPQNAGPIAPEVGTGAANASHPAGSTYPTLVGNGSAHSYSSTHWQVGDYYQFSTGTTGKQGIGVSWDQISSLTGPGYFDLRYSTDGTNFTTAQSYISQPIVWSSSVAKSGSTYTADLSNVATLNNASTVYLQLIESQPGATGGGPVMPGGTTSVDNFTITGTNITSVPEPSSLLLVSVLVSGLGGYAFLGGKRRTRANRAPTDGECLQHSVKGRECTC